MHYIQPTVAQLLCCFWRHHYYQHCQLHYHLLRCARVSVLAVVVIVAVVVAVDVAFVIAIAASAAVAVAVAVVCSVLFVICFCCFR